MPQPSGGHEDQGDADQRVDDVADRADVPLDDVGLAQAEGVAPVLAALGPVTIWSSDLARAAQTADAVAAECGLEPVRDPRLREFDIGPNRVGLTSDEYAVAHPQEHAALLAGQVDAILQDLPVNIEHTRDGDYTIAEEFSTDEQYGFAIKKGNTGLVDAVNEQLDALRDDGRYDEIYDRYFAEG